MESLQRTLRSRWRLALGVLPAVAVVALAKTLVTELGAESIELNPLYTGLVAGNIFLLGAALEHVAAIVRTVLAWLYGQESFDTVLDRVQGLNEHFHAVEPHTQATYVNRIKGEQNATRRMLLRIHSIHETSFVVAGFMVAALTSALLITVLLFIDVGALATDLILLCTLTFLLGYVLLLIRDLDDPFEYSAKGEHAGSVEASLDALIRLSGRLPQPRD